MTMLVSAGLFFTTIFFFICLAMLSFSFESGVFFSRSHCVKESSPTLIVWSFSSSWTRSTSTERQLLESIWSVFSDGKREMSSVTRPLFRQLERMWRPRMRESRLM